MREYRVKTDHSYLWDGINYQDLIVRNETSEVLVTGRDGCNASQFKIMTSDGLQYYVDAEHLFPLSEPLPGSPITLEDLEVDAFYHWNGTLGMGGEETEGSAGEPGTVEVLGILEESTHPLPIHIEVECGDTYWINLSTLTVL